MHSNPSFIAVTYIIKQNLQVMLNVSVLVSELLDTLHLSNLSKRLDMRHLG